MENELSEVHDCEKCRGKIVLIEVDNFGNTHCGYCHQKINYKNVYKDKVLELIEKLILKREESKWQKKKQKKRKKRKDRHEETQYVL
jgi:E3 ubiquitin-protein ligase DOA10